MIKSKFWEESKQQRKNKREIKASLLSSFSDWYGLKIAFYYFYDYDYYI